MENLTAPTRDVWRLELHRLVWGLLLGEPGSVAGPALVVGDGLPAASTANADDTDSSNEEENQ